MKLLFIVLLLWAVQFFAAGCSAGGITVVRNGKAVATIVTAENPPATVELAVAELQHHLEKMTGVRLPRKTDADDVDGPVVLVGESARTRALGLRNEDFKSREYLVRSRPGVLILMGRDKQVRGRLRYDDKLTLADRINARFPLWPGWTKWDDVGSAFAVYHFLERECGVRWYLPTDLGTYVPKKATIAARNLDVRRSPWMVYVEGKFKPVPKRLYWWNRAEPITYDDIASYRDSQLWHLRNKMWGEPFACNHSYGGWPKRFLKKHPDWFSKGYEGRTRDRQLCFSNPEVVAQMIKDARDFFDGKPVPGMTMAAGDMVALVPMDNRSYCKCERCRAEMDPLPEGVEPVDGFNSGVYSRHVFNFVTKVADAVARSHPGKRIGALAYDGYFAVPKNMTRKRDNLAVMVCVQSDSWQYRPAVREYCEAELKKWKKVAGQLYVWIYHCFPQAGKGNKFPGMIYGEYARQMRFFHELGVRGLFNDMDGRCYAYPARGRRGGKVSVWPNPVEDLFSWYVVVKLADDPTLDENRMYAELYRNWFGKAAGAVKAFVDHARKIYNDPKRVRANGRNWRTHFDVAWDVVCTGRDMEILARHMAEAHRLADTPETRKRVKLFDGAVWQCIRAGRATWEKQQSRKGTEATAPRAKGKAGVLDGRSWKGAAKLSRFVTPDGRPLKRGPDEAIRKKGAPDVLSPQTDVEVMYDPEFIYLRVTCHDADTKNLIRERTKHDSGVFYDDAVEIFFDPGRTKKHFRQIIVNANGAVFDAADADVSWNSLAKVAVKVYPKKWVLQVALPTAQLAGKPAKSGDAWGFNVCRDFRARTLSAWSPTFGGWRTPEMFGVLRFK